MMNEKQISSLIQTEIQRAFRAPNVVVNPKSIEAISRTIAQEVMEPQLVYLQTTDATPTVITTIEIAEGENGILEVDVLALQTDGSLGAAYKRLVRYLKTGGALTVVGMGDWNDDDLTVTILIQDDGSDNVEIELTGVAATDIDWQVYINQKKQTATALP